MVKIKGYQVPLCLTPLTLALYILVLLDPRMVLQEVNGQTPSMIPGAYTRRENVYCLEFTGDTCSSCAFDLNYYFYGDKCSKFQNRTSDYFTTTPNKTIIRVCDDQCSSCIQSGQDKGLCSGCKYSTASYAFYGYTSTSGSTKYDKCVTDCDHFGQRYESVSTGIQSTGSCAECSTGCEICASGTLCIECSYPYQRYTNDSTSTFSDEVFKENSTPKACNTRSNRTSTSTLKTTQNYSRTYYVTSSLQNPACTLSSCDGTSHTPFDDINLVFQHLVDVFLLGQKEEAEVNIYLMKSISPDTGKPLEHFWKEKGLASHYTRVFERTAVDVKIQPLFCDQMSVTEACYSINEKANVILKSNKISFFVTKTFTFKNIILDASELIPDSDCYRENRNTSTRCCLDNDGTYPLKANITLLSGNINDAQCEPPTYSLANTNNFLTVPWEAYNSTLDVWKKGPYAFFVMNFLRDYPKYIPTLVIDNCVFKNFWYHRYAYSFIYLDQRASKLNITDTQFQNFYFPMSLITNMQKFTQRNRFFSPNLISTKLSDCKTYNSSLTDCHSLTIQNSIFQDSLFGNFTFLATNIDFYSNEGIVLSLKQFGGSIIIRNNTFRRLASLKFSLVNSSGSAPSTDTICSSPRYDFEYKYRMSLDRHMQVVIGHENWSRTPKTSSILSLFNVTQGVTIYNNTFSNNAAQTGTALFIHNFENTQEKPIIVEQNTFNNNFATEFGTAIAIIKYERDYVNLDCKGVYLAKNTFQNNFGCPYVKGTVIISCMPEKPNLSFLSNIDNPNPETDLMSYMVGYFVSVNDANTFPSRKGGPMAQISSSNRFTDLIVPEYDDLTQEIFSKFIADISKNKDTINVTIHPIHGTLIDTNRITSTQNTFLENHAYQSHLFLQGAYNTLVQETNFTNNSVPVPQFIPQALKNSILFQKVLGLTSYWTSLDMTPLLVRMSNYIVIKDSTFDNTTQLLTDIQSLAFGAAITIDKHLGMSNVSLSNNIFKNNKGWTSSGLYEQLKDMITDELTHFKLSYSLNLGIKGTLITYNYWEYMYGVEIYDPNDISSTASGFYDFKSAIPYVILDSCIVKSNIFNVPSDFPDILTSTWSENTRTALIRRYSAREGVTLFTELSDQHINSFGSFVLYARLSFNNCTFSFNIIQDQRTFINPIGFDSLILLNLKFDSNTIIDETSGYYSLRTFLYSYYQTSVSITSIFAKNLTFTNNSGKILYLEDEKSASTNKYQIVIDGLSIENHISSPDFILHIANKEYTQLSSVTANNVSATSGFLYLNSPGISFELYSITVNKLTSAQTGCLYANGLASGTSFKDFVCQNSLIQETSNAYQDYTVNTLSEERNLLNQLSNIPLSACFALFNTDNLVLNNYKCISPVLQGSSSTIAQLTTTIQNTNNDRILCLYPEGIKSLILSNLVCKLGSTKQVSNDKKVYLGYFEGLDVLQLISSTIESNVVNQTFVIEEGKAYIENSVFFNNTAYTMGSAVLSKSNAELEITDTEFTNNTCEGCLGTLSVITKSLTMKNTTFMYNKAQAAGAIYSSLSRLEISDCIFQENVVESMASVISSEYCVVDINGSSFTKNSVSFGKSAFFFYEGTVTLRNNTFSSNKATNGPRNIEGLDATRLEIENCTFTDDDNNESLPLVRGGFVFVRNTKGSITQSNFIDGKGSSGGSIYLDLKQKTTFSISNSTFKRCKVDTQGEAIYAKGIQDSLLQLQDVFVSCGTPVSYRTSQKELAAIYCYRLTCQFTDVEMNPLYAEADSGNQIYLYQGYNYTLTRVKLISDCVQAGNCDRTKSCALRVEEVMNLNVEDSIFQGWGTKNDSLGGAVRLDFPLSKVKDKIATYSFKNCTWNKNEANKGGAIFAIGVMNVTLNGANFDSNQAEEQGGGIYWESSSLKSTFSIKGSTFFTNNIATSGAGYYFKAKKIECEGLCIFKDNQAPYGSDKGSYAVYVLLVDNPDPSLYIEFVNKTKVSLGIATRLLGASLENRILTDSIVYESGENIEPPMVLKIYDEFGQHIATDNSSQVIVSAYSPYGELWKVDGNPFKAENGYVILFPLKVYATPGFNVTFKFALSSFNPTSLGRNSSEFSNLYVPSSKQISLRECVKGERLSDDNACIACSAGKYTILYNSSEGCMSCPTGGICLGYDKFGPDINYFKLNYSQKTPIECLNDEACRGAVIDKSEVGSLYCAEPKEEDPTFCYTGWCERGYQGNLCADCQDGYAYRNTDTRTCARCKNNPYYYVISVIIGLGGIIYIVFIIRSALKEDKDDVKQVIKPKLVFSESINEPEQGEKTPEQFPSFKSLEFRPAKLIKYHHESPHEKDDLRKLDSNNGKEGSDNSPKARFLDETTINNRKMTYDSSPEKKALIDDLPANIRSGSAISSSSEKKKLIEEVTTKHDDIGKDEDEEELALTSIYLKIFTNYIQIVSIIGTFNFEWPEQITAFFTSSEQVTKSTSNVISIDCLLRQPLFQLAGINSFYAKLLVMALSPAALVIIIGVVWIIVYLIKYGQNIVANKKQLRTNIITSIVVTLFILHPNIVQISIQSFKCVQLGDTIEEIYVESILDEKCWSPTHLKWALMIGLPSLVVWGLGIPVFAFFILHHYKRKLHLKSIKARFGFLYEGFYKQRYYWEFVIFYRKMILIIISIFMTQYSTNIQGALVIGVACMSYILQISFSPFLTNTLNEMEKRSLIASAVTVYCGLFYLTKDVGSMMKIVFFVGIILANVYFFIYFVLEFIKGKAKELLKIPILKRLFGRWLKAVANFKIKLRKAGKVYRSFSFKKNEIPQDPALNFETNNLSPKANDDKVKVDFEGILREPSLAKPENMQFKSFENEISYSRNQLGLSNVCLIENEDAPKAKNNFGFSEGLDLNQVEPKPSKTESGKLSKLLQKFWKQGKLKMDLMQSRTKTSQDKLATMERSPPKTKPSKNFEGYRFEKLRGDNNESLKMGISSENLERSIVIDGPLFELFNAQKQEKGVNEDNRLNRMMGDQEIEEIDDHSLLKFGEEGRDNQLENSRPLKSMPQEYEEYGENLIIKTKHLNDPNLFKNNATSPK